MLKENTKIIILTKISIWKQLQIRQLYIQGKNTNPIEAVKSINRQIFELGQAKLFHPCSDGV